MLWLVKSWYSGLSGAGGGLEAWWVELFTVTIIRANSTALPSAVRKGFIGTSDGL
jgi:hypothetical protein